ncbi:MAG TPA: hypothetical protein VG734_01860 [Lacunisphaera sp.]|nr:hypothetical protein [Lacunisphaera sp.]
MTHHLVTHRARQLGHRYRAEQWIDISVELNSVVGVVDVGHLVGEPSVHLAVGPLLGDLLERSLCRRHSGRYVRIVRVLASTKPPHQAPKVCKLLRVACDRHPVQNGKCVCAPSCCRQSFCRLRHRSSALRRGVLGLTTVDYEALTLAFAEANTHFPTSRRKLANEW